MNTTRQNGFTLLEITFVILLAAILATMTSSLLRNTSDGERFESTRRKMEAIRTAILGSNQLDPRGFRMDFGYHGDLGTLPPSLSALTAPQTPAWAMVATYGFGAGWKGPYYQPNLFDPYTVSTDAWGQAFLYSTTSVTSYGSDGAAGGSVYAQDLVLPLSTADRLARVRGVVRDGSSGLSGRTVQIVYPLAGALTTSSAVTDANGFFIFTDVPFGPRSVMVTDAPGIGAKPVMVANAEVFLDSDILNYYGGAQKITVNTSTAACVAGDKFYHRVGVSSSYMTVTTLGYLTVWWQNTAARLNTIVLNSTAESVGSLASGSRITLTKTMTLPVASQRDLELRWSSKTDSVSVAAEMEWKGLPDKDQISWITNTCANPAIAINSATFADYGNSQAATTTPYTIPAGLSDVTLVVFGGAGDNTGNVRPTGASFTGKAMTVVTTGAAGSSGDLSGLGMFWLAVTSGQTGNIIVNYPGAATDHSIFAASLNSTDGLGPEAYSISSNPSGVTSVNVTTLSNDAMIVSGSMAISGNQTYATGSNGGPLHVLDLDNRQGPSSSGQGHVSAATAMSVQGIGFTAASTSNMVVIGGAFKYKP